MERVAIGYVDRFVFDFLLALDAVISFQQVPQFTVVPVIPVLFMIFRAAPCRGLQNGDTLRKAIPSQRSFDPRIICQDSADVGARGKHPPSLLGHFELPGP